MSEFKNLIAKPTRATPKRVKLVTPKADFKNNPRTKTNEPTALTPQRTSKIAKPGPTKAHAKIHRTRRGASGNHDRRSQEKTHHLMHFKKLQQAGPAKKNGTFRRDLKSRLRAFFTWSRTLITQTGLKKTADRCARTSYHRRSASNHSLLRVQRRALRSLEKNTRNKKQKCIRWKKASVALTAPSARRWRKTARITAYFPRRKPALLKSFTNMLRGFNEHAGKKDTAVWKAKQAARIASWYVYHYHPYRQRAWLDSVLFKRTQQLKYSLGDTQRLTNALLKKIKKDTAALDANARPSDITEFFARVNKVRRDLQRWRSQPRSKNKKQKLRRILQQLVQPKTSVVTSEDRVAKLLWLFLTPQIRFKTAVPLSHLRPVARNKKKNLWRKLTPVLSSKAREQVYINVKQKVHELCISKNRLRRDVFDKERIYGLEKLKLRLRDPRAVHRSASVTRKKVWRRRPRRRQLGKKRRQQMRRKVRRRIVGKTRQLRVKTPAVTAINCPTAQITTLAQQRVTRPDLAVISLKTTQKSGQARPFNLNAGLQHPFVHGVLCATRTVPLTVKKMATAFSRFHSTLGLTKQACGNVQPNQPASTYLFKSPGVAQPLPVSKPRPGPRCPFDLSFTPASPGSRDQKVSFPFFHRLQMAYYTAYYYLFVDPDSLALLVARSPVFRRLEQNKIARHILFIPWLTKKITEMEGRKAQVRDRQYRLIELNNRAMHDLGKNKNLTKEEREYCRDFIYGECNRRRAASGHSPYQPTGNEKMDLEFITKQFDAIDGRDIVPLRLDDTFLTYNPRPPEVVLPPLESAPFLEQLWMIFSVTLKFLAGMVGVAALSLLLIFLYAGFLHVYFPGELDRLAGGKPKIQPPQSKKKGETPTQEK